MSSLLGPNRGKDKASKPSGITTNSSFTRSSKAKADLRAKKFPSPFRQPDGTLYPRIFRKYTHAPSEITMPAPQSPMFTTVLPTRNSSHDTHVMAVVTVRKHIEERPGEFVSAVGAVFAPNSIYNHSSVVSDATTMPAFQIRAMNTALAAAYQATDDLKKAGCQRLVITLDREMEWIAHVVCRWQDLLDRAMDDEILMYNFFRYPELMTNLVDYIDTFEAVTRIRVQFWPTEIRELSGAYVFVNKAVDNYIAHHLYLGSDSEDEDYADDEDSEDCYTSEEEEVEADVRVKIGDVEQEPELVADIDETVTTRMGAVNIESTDDEAQPVTPPSGTFSVPSTEPERALMPFERLFRAAGIDCAMIEAAADTGPSRCGPILAKLAFGVDTYEELLQTPIFREAARAVAANPTQDEASRFVSGLL